MTDLKIVRNRSGRRFVQNASIDDMTNAASSGSGTDRVLADDFGSGSQLSFLDNPVLVRGLPEEAHLHLLHASEGSRFSEVAETHLLCAQEIAPGHPAVMLAHYRFYSYKGRRREALGVAQASINRALEANNLGSDWRQLNPKAANFRSRRDLLPRFVMVLLKGYAHLAINLGQLGDAREAAEKLLELDPMDRIGAWLLLDVLDRMENNDE